jgi:chromosomal replication initiator protein
VNEKQRSAAAGLTKGKCVVSSVDAGLWQRIIEHVVAHAGNLIRPWFDQLDPISMEHGLLEIQAPGPAQQRYLHQHALRLFTEAAQAATGRLVGVCFLLPPAAEAPAVPAGTPAKLTAPGQDESPAGPQEDPLNPEYTFENLVTGPCNRLAHAACVAVCETPGKTYNPLFIHGDVGLGKTHLLHAICHEMAGKSANGGGYCMLSCEMFVNHFIEAVEHGQLHDFRYRYRHADVLIIDDVQFLSGREQTQEEFFHTFNALYQTQKQIILSSDRGPGEIEHLEDRLVSRFSWGLVARVDKPGYETRVAIVRKKARLRSMELGEDVVCLIAACVDSNPRELEGAIAKLALLAKAYGRSIDLSLAQEALGADGAPTKREITIQQILEAVTHRFNVRLADLQSHKRHKSIAFPRQVCMYLARQLTRHSLEEVGGYFGGRDHSTVLHANRTVQSLRQNDGQVNALLEQMTNELQRNG